MIGGLVFVLVLWYILMYLAGGEIVDAVKQDTGGGECTGDDEQGRDHLPRHGGGGRGRGGGEEGRGGEDRDRDTGMMVGMPMLTSHPFLPTTIGLKHLRGCCVLYIFRIHLLYSLSTFP
jgi:hypothetical protein